MLLASAVAGLADQEAREAWETLDGQQGQDVLEGGQAAREGQESLAGLLRQEGLVGL